MQRVLVLVSSDSGKSTFGRRLSARLGVELFPWDFFRWIWDYPREIRPAPLEMLNSQDQARIICLRATGRSSVS